MRPDSFVTPADFAAALVEGALLGLLFVTVTHTRLRRYLRPVLFVTLLIAALAYVVFALGARADPLWILIGLCGVVAFGGLGWIGLHSSLGWLAGAWALHPAWDAVTGRQARSIAVQAH